MDVPWRSVSAVTKQGPMRFFMGSFCAATVIDRRYNAAATVIDRRYNVAATAATMR